VTENGTARVTERKTGKRPRAMRPPPRVHRGELISLCSAVLLLIIMFALEWYGVDEMPGLGPSRTGLSHSINAWHGLTVVRWVLLAAIVVSFGSVVVHATQRSHGVKTDTGLIVWLFGSAASLLLVYRVLIDLPSPDSVVDQKLGAYLGLLSAIGIAYGGFESMREERARARWRVAHAGARERVAEEPAAR
jgi:hypothetical protein